MLIEKDAYLVSRNKENFLCWSFTTSGGKKINTEEKLTNETLRKSKIVNHTKEEPVMAIRVKNNDGYKVVDLLPASLPLNQALFLEAVEKEGESIKLSLKSSSKQWVISLNSSDPFSKHLWLFETGLQIAVKVLKGRDSFRLSLQDSGFPKSLSGVLYNFKESNYGYDAWMETSINGENIHVRCSLSKQQCWLHCIDSFLEPNVARLPAALTWSDKYKQYQVSYIEPLLSPGRHNFELTGYNTQENRQYLKLMSEYEELAGIQFSVLYPKFAPQIGYFQRCSTQPIYLNADLSINGDNLKFKLVSFKVPPELSLIGNISPLPDDGQNDQSQPVYRIEVQGLGHARLTLLSTLQIPSDIEIVSTSGQQSIPITFSSDKLKLLLGVSRDEGTVIKDTFYSSGFSNDLPDYALFSSTKAQNNLAFRVHMKELHRFGIASVEKGEQIGLTLVSCHPPSARGLEWKISEIHQMECLANGLKLRDTHINREAYVLRGWSAMQPSPVIELCDLSSLYYLGGALASVTWGSGVHFLLPLSASLLSEKGIVNLKKGEQLSTSFEMCLDQERQQYVLVCSDLDENRITNNKTSYSELRFLGTDNTKENTLIFEVTKAEGIEPSVGTQIKYKLREKEKIPFESLILQGDVRFTVVMKQFRGEHYITQFTRVDIG